LEQQITFGEGIAGIVYLVAAARLYHRSRRNGEAAERMLAGAFAFIGMSSIIYTSSTIPRFESLWTPLNFAGRILFMPAALSIAMFTRRVFRPDGTLAAYAVWANPVVFTIGVAGSVVFRSDWEGFSTGSPWFWMEWFAFTYPFAWAGTEAFLQYRQARRRVRLGLCDPLVCNRQLLWALFGTFYVCAHLVLFPQYAEYEASQLFGSFWDSAYGGTSVLAMAMMWHCGLPSKRIPGKASDRVMACLALTRRNTTSGIPSASPSGP